MLATPGFLVARPIVGLVPVEDARTALRVVIASLARGGAERIVLDWLDAEAHRGRAIELAVLHARRNAWHAPAGVRVIERRGETPEAFIASIAERWRDSATAVATHLVDDALLALLWNAGIATVPTVHNAREGWRNDPACWRERFVPHAIACAESVRAQLAEAGCAVPAFTVRHMPGTHRTATDDARRRALRAAWNVDASTFLVGTVGAFKAQKDFPRAVEIVAALRARRKAALVVLGGVLDASQLAELERTLDRMVRLGMQEHVKLPGFVDPIGAWYAACDALVSASRYEGLSMAAREALAAGLPVVALDVGGQREIEHERLALLPADSAAAEVAEKLARLPVRARLTADPTPRAPRVWSVASAWRRPEVRTCATLFVTANLNAGGAQRSLVNLAAAIAARHPLAIAVCGDTTHGAFAEALRAARIRCFRPAPSPDPFALAESLLLEANRSGVRTICFWNADPRVKLLMAKFLAPGVTLVDASPGAYAFAEMARERAFAATITFSIEAYYQRLDLLVLKHHTEDHPRCRATRVIPNGVALPQARSRRPATPRFVVSGRIAPSKRLETIVAAFAQLRERHPEGELHLVGQAEARHARYAAELVAAANGHPVRFRGALPALEHLAEDFSAAVVLGTHQGCPNAVLEAMAAGIPVIANASGGTGELVRDGETGWLIAEEANAGELARAMIDCAAHPGRADALAIRARERVQRDFSIEAMAQGYLACFAGRDA